MDRGGEFECAYGDLVVGGGLCFDSNFGNQNQQSRTVQISIRL